MAEIVLITDVALENGYSKYAGTYRIATELRHHDFEVKVIDLFSVFTESEITALIAKFVSKTTLFVGFSTTFFRTAKSMEHFSSNGRPVFGHLQREDFCPEGVENIFPHSFSTMTALFKQIKEIHAKIAIVVGGAWSVYRQKYPGIDFWVVGQAENSVVALARHLKFGDNLAVKVLDGKRILDHKDFPYRNFARSQIHWDASDHVFHGEQLPIEIARGCIFRCSFCAYELNGKSSSEWSKSMDTLREELIRNYTAYGIRGYLISDDTLNDSAAKVRGLYEVITSLPFAIEWCAYLRLDVIHRYPEMREMLLEMGIRGAYFGIETLDQKAGKLAGKPLGRERSIETLHYLAEKWSGRVHMHSGFIVGLPGETEESIWETFSWATSAENPLNSFHFKELVVAQGDAFDIYKQALVSRPERYQISLIPREDSPLLDWRHATMDNHRAAALVRELNKDPRLQNVRILPGTNIAWLGRLVNVGFTYDELVQFRRSGLDKQKFVTKVKAGTDAARERYRQAIFSY